MYNENVCCGVSFPGLSKHTFLVVCPIVFCLLLFDLRVKSNIVGSKRRHLLFNTLILKEIDFYFLKENRWHLLQIDGWLSIRFHPFPTVCDVMQ
jgi:hypothetical protein